MKNFWVFSALPFITILIGVSSFSLWGSKKVVSNQEDTGPTVTERVSQEDVRLPITIVEEEPERAIFIGDIHGDMAAFKNSLRMAQLIDEKGNWSGGQTVLVQNGDVFDRGDEDLAIEEYLYELRNQAIEAGGNVYRIWGNHEMLNVRGDHSSATRDSFTPFEPLGKLVDSWISANGHLLTQVPDWSHPRIASMQPGGPVARLMSDHSIAMKIGSNLVVHAGILESHFFPPYCDLYIGGGLNCFEAWNKVAQSYVLGLEGPPNMLLWHPDGPIWTRQYSMPDGAPLSLDAEDELKRVLELTGTKRLIIGHTVQRMGINSAAGGRVWRIDTGMSAIYRGRTEVLEVIKGEDVSILTANGKVHAASRDADTFDFYAGIEL